MRKKKKKKIVKIRKRKKNDTLILRYRRNQHRIYTFLIASISIAVLTLLIFIFKKTLFSEKYTIGNVTYNEESLKIYDNPPMYHKISQEFLGKNYYWTRRFYEKNIQKKIQAQYPIIEKVEMKFIEKKTIEVTLLFHEPTLIFRTAASRVATHKKHFYTLQDTDLLGAESIQVDLPRYASGYDSLHGVLYKVSAQQLKTITTSIYNTLESKNIEEFTYLPGGQLIFLRYKGKQVYLNIKQNIDAQLIKLIDLENRYPDFQYLQKIDIGSSDDSIVK